MRFREQQFGFSENPDNRNYYEILGLMPTATAEEIKAAYRRLAMNTHPDKSKNKEAEEKFKMYNEVNQILSDPEKRRLYDQKYGFDYPDNIHFTPPETEKTETRSEEPRLKIKVEQFHSCLVGEDGASLSRSYQKIEELKGCFIGTFFEGEQFSLDPRTGKEASGPYKKIIVREELLVAIDDKGERILDAETGKTVCEPFQRIFRRGDKVIGKTFAREEEIQV